MRPEVLAEVREWLERAADDLREAEHDLEADPPLVRGAVFHCQQAAEKALKAFLTAQEQPFRKTHDLDELGRVAAEFDGTLGPIVDEAVDLTPYAWRFRYPGVRADPSEDEARDAVRIARGVLNDVLSRVPKEARP